ncbi:amidase family protein [Streptobacillus moniliformis]|uniref:amidase family protein n=1 Tax=Streptobacillus moniliformis TaxID=34105 RepID=UPI0007E3221F|nr:amidase family protein [Streptobacillus moniliformis]
MIKKFNKTLIKLSSLLLLSILTILPMFSLGNNNIEARKNSVYTLTKEEYKKLSAVQMAKLVKEKKVTPKELIDLAYEVIAETDPILNNIIKHDGSSIDAKLKERAYLEAENVKNMNKPFYGVPILVKGITFELKDGVNSQALVYRKDNISKEDNALVKMFTDLGFIPIAQTTIPQLGWINVTNSDLYGVTRNPWDTTKNPGGSSGGTAAGVAIGQTAIGTANDGGGSIRIPSSFSSLIGYFPTGGVIKNNSASEGFKLENFLIAEKMEDVLAIAKALHNPEYKLNDKKLSKDKVIAYTTKTPANTPISPEAIMAVENAVKFLRDMGYTLEEVDYPIDGKAMMMAYYTNASYIGSRVGKFAETLLNRPLEMNDVELLTWALYQAGNKLNSEDINNTKEVLKGFRKTVDEFFDKYQAFITPTTSYPAPSADYNHIPEELKAKMRDMSDLTKEEAIQLIYDQWLPAWTITPFTQLSNVTDTPSISIPTHLTKNRLPLGVLISSGRFDDNIILEIAKLFEDNNRFFLYQDYEK